MHMQLRHPTSARIRIARPGRAAHARDNDRLTRRRAGLHGWRVSLLLPQTRAGTVRSATPVSIHGDRYVDLVIALEGETGPPVVGRVGADDCPEPLTPGERVSVRFTVG